MHNLSTPCMRITKRTIGLKLLKITRGKEEKKKNGTVTQ